MTEGEFNTLLKRVNETNYKTLNINYQVGNLEEQHFKAMQKTGIQDSKILATDYTLWHSTGDKNAKQKIPEELFGDVYRMLQEPEAIYQEKVPVKTRQHQIFHLVKGDKNGKKIKIIVHVKRLGNGQTVMQIRTMGYAEYDYRGTNYVKIW
jgi:hypothetical protein